MSAEVRLQTRRLVFEFLVLIIVLGPIAIATYFAISPIEDGETEKDQGHHCLNLWNDRHPGLERKIKDELADPASYEHIQTTLGVPTDWGSTEIQVRFRARNAFGGMVVESVEGHFRHSDCGFEPLSPEIRAWREVLELLQ